MHGKPPPRPARKEHPWVSIVRSTGEQGSRCCVVLLKLELLLACASTQGARWRCSTVQTWWSNTFVISREESWK